MTKTIIPWAPYAENETMASSGRRTLVSVFGDLVLSQQGFPPHELPEIFAAPEDEGENDACQHLVSIDAAFLTTQFVLGKITTFARPMGGGEAVAISPALWELDDALPRMATGALNLEHWADPEAPPTHRIPVDATEFDLWLVQLAPPGDLDDADLEAFADPRMRAARTLAAKGRSARRQRKQVEAQECHDLRPAASDPSSEGLLTMHDVRRLTKLGRSTIGRMRDAGSFPEPLTIGKRNKRWPAGVIHQWIAAQGGDGDSRD